MKKEISIKELNDLRRTLTQELIEKRQFKKNHFIKQNVCFEPVTIEKKQGLTATVFTKEQLDMCLELNLKRIYVDNKELYDIYQNNPKIF